MSTKEIIVQFLIILAIAYTTKCGLCPAKEVIAPCVCSLNTTIRCEGNQTIDLKKLFKTVSINLDGEDKNFTDFILNNTAIKIIEDNTFFDITFTKIVLINTTSLARIEANAFSTANTYTVEYVYQFGASLIGADAYLNETFTALSSLVNAVEIKLEQNLLKSIPSHAFDTVNGFQQKLKTVVFNFQEHTDQTLAVLGNYMFAHLNGLTELYMRHLLIDKIPIHAFDFLHASQNRLLIDLSFNKLTNVSIDIGAFTNANRPLTIQLDNNLLTHLDERVFEFILRTDKRNQLKVAHNPLDCDCRMSWIMRGRETLRTQITVLECKTGNSFWNMTDTEFIGCEA